MKNFTIQANLWGSTSEIMLIKFEHLTCSLSLRIHDSVTAALGSVGQPTLTVLLFIEASFLGTFYFVTKGSLKKKKKRVTFFTFGGGRVRTGLL